MSRVNVADLKPKTEIESTFRIKYFSVMEAKDGKNYANIILSDATGDLESRVWNEAMELAQKVEKGDFVKVSGKVNFYQGKKQFIIKTIEPVDAAEIDEQEFIAKAKRSSEDMYADLINIVESLEDIYIKTLLKDILNDSEISRRLKTWQAGKSIHHAYQGGLLEHVLNCCRLGDHLSEFYHCNKSYVIAGCILHDLCKIHELTDGMNVEYTEEGKLVGHLVKSVELLDRFAYRIENFPYNMKLHLKHILLAHHGHYEYGSPKLPQTTEAMLVHLIDLMDSRMGIFDEIKRKDNNTGHWSNYVKHLDRLVFKGDLPTYKEFIPSNGEKKSKKSHSKKELKQNMADKLKGFKVKE